MVHTTPFNRTVWRTEWRTVWHVTAGRSGGLPITWADRLAEGLAWLAAVRLAWADRLAACDSLGQRLAEGLAWPSLFGLAEGLAWPSLFGLAEGLVWADGLRGWRRGWRLEQPPDSTAWHGRMAVTKSLCVAVGWQGVDFCSPAC